MSPPVPAPSEPVNPVRPPDPAHPVHPAGTDIGWVEIGCELAGTALLVVGGTLAVCLGFGPASPLVHHVGDAGLRLLLTGLLFAGSGALVTISPLGRRSGAHLNPAVTLAFWLDRHLTWRNAVGYVVAQFAGATLGAALLGLVVHRWVSTPSVSYAVTRPGPGTGPVAASLIEAAMTATLVLVIFGFVSSRRTARWTPLAVWLLVSALVWRLAPRTGTSLNPARTFGPDLVASTWADYGVYVVGPLAGAALAVAAWVLVPRRTLTAKLLHDPRYRSVLASYLPVHPASGPAGAEGSLPG